MDPQGRGRPGILFAKIAHDPARTNTIVSGTTCASRPRKGRNMENGRRFLPDDSCDHLRETQTPILSVIGHMRGLSIAEQGMVAKMVKRFCDLNPRHQCSVGDDSSCAEPLPPLRIYPRPPASRQP